MNDDDPLPMDVDRISPDTFVGEVVMKQQITPFLAAAQEKGCPIQVGTDMLFEQIPAYLEFFGFGQTTADELRAVSQIRTDDDSSAGRHGGGAGRAPVGAAAGHPRRAHASAPTCCTTTSGDVLVDCGIAAGPEPPVPGAEPDPCGALDQALRAAGSRLERIARLVVTHAHIDHFGLAGEVVRRSGGELWMHEASRLDLDKYHDPDEAVDRRMLMLADHGLYGRELTESSEGLLDWMPVMPSIAAPDRSLSGGEQLAVGDRELGGRAHPRTLARAHLPVLGGRPGALLGRSPAAGRVPAGHLRARLRARPDGVLPGLAGAGRGAGAGAGAARARPAVPGRGPAGGDHRPRQAPPPGPGPGDGRAARADRHRDHRDPVPRRADRRPAPLRDGRDPGRPCVSRGPRQSRAGPPAGRYVRRWRPTGDD